ncbi:DHH family phosphoesterase [Thiohalophilus sp.]|uniref:DHH family phosphoesterase n=1 Tax=Thiohalophilus sp. TaxID=3028392 RepID=UPI002ACDD166|nr:DHH family phosphoesterase [Thiohalophilus sp.]MDZ7662644.1 DHH family phosphoesterase [Thiohalophilus sp.]
MAYIDVFNGDADGICALQQLRLANPKKSQLVTGIKRDIELLKKVEAVTGDQVTILDISLDKNRDELIRLLDAGAGVLYFDHHYAGEIPQHSALETHIDTDANICSGLLVNRYLENAYLPWAVVAAFGDNLFTAAQQAASPLNLNGEQLEELKLLGTCLNYNGYGANLSDLVYTPDDLYRLVAGYADPFAFIHEEPGYARLQEAYYSDFERVKALTPDYVDAHHALYVLPDAHWARRVSGIYANDLAQQYPDRAHAMLSIRPEGGFLVSLRAPLNNKRGADELCRQFDTGGGRKAAAGINHLPEEQYDAFVQAFKTAF